MFQGIRILDHSISSCDSVSTWKFDLTPVDWAACIIARFAIHFPSYALGDFFHIQSPHTPLTSERVLSFLGSQTNGGCTDFSNWRNLLSKKLQEFDIDDASENSMILRKLFSTLDSTVGYLQNSIVFDCSNLVRKIEIIKQKEGANLDCPQIENETLKKYFNYF